MILTGEIFNKKLKALTDPVSEEYFDDLFEILHNETLFSTVKRGYSGHFLFYFYFELKDNFEQSKCPQLLVTYPRMYQK